MKIPFTPTIRPLALAACLALPGLAMAQTAPVQSALQQFSSQRAKFGLSSGDVADPAVTSSYTDAGGELTHIYLRQRYQGIEIYGAEADLHVDRSQKVVSLHSNFVANLANAGRSATTQPALTAVQGVAAAAKVLNLGTPSNLNVVKAGTPAEGLTFDEGGVSLEKIPVKLMYQARPSGELVLVWDVTIVPKKGDHYWNVRVDAATGQLVDKMDLTIHEPVSFVELTQRSLATSTWPAPLTNAVAATPNSYNVYPITVDSPLSGSRQLVVNPADPTYSPFGWHDTNGVAGPEYTITRGNNVHAYEDRVNANAPGYSPDGGADLVFDFPVNFAQVPQANQDAAITNLFYWNNIMHDVMAYKGFDEVSGNFQVKNYTGAGLGNDDVRAEAQDGGGTDNANFGTPNDGSRPRMQMYLWSAPASLVINAPSPVAGTYKAIPAGFGKKLAPGVPFTGQFVLVNDASSTSLGCTAPFVNAAAIAGKIAVLDRGTCDFSAKVRNAKLAGAKGVVVVNNVAGDPITMGAGADTTNTGIPSVMISLADGTNLKANLAAGGTPSGAITGGIPRDGDFDNGIISHEYGHGISTRLTGGPANSSCLNNAEQMGEGWSDFFGLWMTTKPGDVGATPRPVGNFATSRDVNGVGIRTKPYSTDFAVNNLTYALIGTTAYSEVHATGEVWAATLWDLNWKLVEKYGYNKDLKAKTGGNNIALKLVLDGCKLQVCRPGFLDGRDAILKADSLYNNKANTYLIWQVFARRGMGIDAVQGSSNVLTDNSAGYLIPVRVLATQSQQQRDQLLELFPNPASSSLTLRLPVRSSTPVEVSLQTVLGKSVRRSVVASAELQQGVELNTSEVAAGLYIVQLRTSAGTFSKKVLIQH
ncbi:T9SS-dependent M36 family metallopeptidase [Hymenobacter sp. GOD-10R]|uniref:T9SS-dependent M36 family metallopeptidase n=1 Tax=Hymenobacter sp. GOD-10R TaxID=3093922 RepID=UPI002D774ED7|nr:T9SS-dependent M36 family metallopeptidase [Hymenobacter sp. GOD-10R]WRQ29276.1 T9SS-dependent M36 family metallopeptidase [Hymenobacter sp. GOD-10R]